MNWIKSHVPHCWATLGAVLVVVGVLLLVPRSPYTLIVIGSGILFITLISILPDNT